MPARARSALPSWRDGARELARDERSPDLPPSDAATLAPACFGRRHFWDRHRLLYRTPLAPHQGFRENTRPTRADIRMRPTVEDRFGPKTWLSRSPRRPVSHRKPKRQTNTKPDSSACAAPPDLKSPKASSLFYFQVVRARAQVDHVGSALVPGLDRFVILRHLRVRDGRQINLGLRVCRNRQLKRKRSAGLRLPIAYNR